MARAAISGVAATIIAPPAIVPTPAETIRFPSATPLAIPALHAVPPPEPEIMQTLRKVCKLSARKQRQIAEFIEVVTRPQKRAEQQG